jgi:glutamine synthetase
MAMQLEAMGVPIKYHHHEVGSPGQSEIETPMMGLVAAIEFRPPDATCNIYLALAAQLLAGLDGIRREIDPSDAGFGPIDADTFSWTPTQRDSIQRLPDSLEKALNALEADHDFLLAGEVFSQELIDQWVEHKMRAEFYQVLNRPHPYEMSLYFDA